MLKESNRSNNRHQLAHKILKVYQSQLLPHRVQSNLCPPTTITSTEDWNYVGRPTGPHRRHAEKRPSSKAGLEGRNPIKESCASQSSSIWLLQAIIQITRSIRSTTLAQTQAHNTKRRLVPNNQSNRRKQSHLAWLLTVQLNQPMAPDSSARLLARAPQINWLPLI